MGRQTRSVALVATVPLIVWGVSACSATDQSQGTSDASASYAASPLCATSAPVVSLGNGHGDPILIATFRFDGSHALFTATGYSGVGRDLQGTTVKLGPTDHPPKINISNDTVMNPTLVVDIPQGKAKVQVLPPGEYWIIQYGSATQIHIQACDGQVSDVTGVPGAN